MNVQDKTVTTMTSRDFNQDTARAKRAARNGPVFITDRGKPSHVLISIEDYQRMKGEFVSLADALADPNPEADFEYDFPQFKGVFKGFEFD